MKKSLNAQLILKMMLLALIAAPACFISCQGPTQAKQKILIITGGHDFEREEFFEMFDAMPGISYGEIMHPEANQVYDSSLMDKTDVLVFYDMYQKIDSAQKTAFLKLLEEGKGMVFLHHSLASYQDWPEFEQIRGGRYILADEEGSTYMHDVDMSIEVVSNDHPVTRGINDFVIHDETYGNFAVEQNVQPLLHCSHPESGELIAWAKQYGNSRIVYLQLGHDHHAYENPNFRQLLSQAIAWVH
jgi:type 1 glutamine amidotransferase